MFEIVTKFEGFTVKNDILEVQEGMMISLSWSEEKQVSTMQCSMTTYVYFAREYLKILTIGGSGGGPWGGPVHGPGVIILSTSIGHIVAALSRFVHVRAYI